MANVAVVGSVNLDIVATAARLPTPGETVTDAVLDTHPGGKGANQALAAQRMGADVSLVARVGRDANADQALRLLRDGGVNLSRVTVDDDAATGVALIAVGAGGENQIVVAPGANRTLRPEHVDVSGAAAVVCQLEVPIEAVAAAAERCEGLFCLNAAPVRPLPDHVLDRIDVVVVNEIEAAQLGDVIHRPDVLVALTLGARGAQLYRNRTLIAAARPPVVDVVDTTGSGDAFVGGLVASLVAGHDEPQALSRAVTAGSLAATVPGAQPSLPTAAQVEELM